MVTISSLFSLSLSLLAGQPDPAWVEAGVANVQVDGRRATLVRTVRRDGVNAALGGEHVSRLHADDGRLLGYARMSTEMRRGARLPSEQQARDVALQVLRRHAPDLLDAHRVHWVAPHDETIRVATAGAQREITLRGMKVKMRATEGSRLWFWVIVGPEQQVMVFERDIYWVTMPGHRRTEKWLHDDWLAQRPDVRAVLFGQASERGLR